MSIMIEVIYHGPCNSEREDHITMITDECNGRLTHKEEPENAGVSQSVCLTYEFADRNSAQTAVNQLRNLGEHVEGPMDYGDD